MATPGNALHTQHSTYAVVVGISDYQDPAIPDLRYADKDAEAFAMYLRSDAGGKLDNDHLKLLLNKDATVAQFAIALDWLLEVVKENDKVIIYFSGHGDVEKKTLTQPGFLLCWDAPARVYMAGGAFALPMLQEVISTLSIQNKAKVIVIADACRSGNLAGSSIGGSQATAANLAKQFANEIKILSCQPNEYSIEGEQWGGGRGAFSYNLVNALYGLADGNKDLQVSLKEVDRYLEDNVAAEVAPVNQNPQVIGNPTEVLSKVNERMLAAVRESKRGIVPGFSAVDSRGIEEDVLVSVDTSIRLTYRLFKQALKEKRFLEPEESSAEWYYNKLIKEPGLGKLHSTIRRNYAAALQDDAQQVLNTMLKSGLTEAILKGISKEKLYRNYPSYLKRAGELLGEQHYMYNILRARQYYFEGVINNKANYKRAAFHQALHLQPDMPHAMIELIKTFDAGQLDSADHYFRKAFSVVPQWLEPYFAMAYFFENKLNQTSAALGMLNRAEQIDTSSPLLWYKKGIFYYHQKDIKLSEKYFLKVVKRADAEICFPCALHYLGSLYSSTKRYEEAEKYFTLAIDLDPTFLRGYGALGTLFRKTHRYKESELAYKKAIDVDSTYLTAWYNLGKLYHDTNRKDEAEQVYKRIIALDSTFVPAWNDLGLLYYGSDRKAEAEQSYKKAIALKPTYEHAWNNLRKLFFHNHQYREAEEFFNLAICLDTSLANPRKQLGMVYLKTNRFEESRVHFRKALEIDPDYSEGYLGMAYLSMYEGKTTEALGYLDLAMNKGIFLDELENDEELASMRLLPEWKALLKKYFPEQFKD